MLARDSLLKRYDNPRGAQDSMGETVPDGRMLIRDIFVLKIQTKPKATEFYNGKVEELGTNLQDLGKAVQGKSQNLKVVEEREWNAPSLLLQANVHFDRTFLGLTLTL